MCFSLGYFLLAKQLVPHFAYVKVITGVVVGAACIYERVHRQFQTLIQHLRDQPLQEQARRLQIRIGVHLYQRQVQIFIQHVVKPQHFKPIIQLELLVGVFGRLVQNLMRRLKHVFNRLLDFGQNFDVKRYSFFLEQKFIEVLIRQLVARLKFAVVIGVFLDSVIGQVDQAIVYLVGVVFFAARAQVPLFKQIPTQVPRV